MLVRRLLRGAILPTILVLLCGLGTAASAMPALAEPDFTPFELHEDYWTAAMVTYADGRVAPGSASYDISYVDRNHWVVIQRSHSFEPQRTGTTWTFDGVTLTQIDTLRGVTRSLPRPDAADNWVQPGQLTALSNKFGAAVRDDSASNSREISWSWIGPSGVTGKTVALFDRATRLPLEVEDWNGNTLMRRITFTRTK